MRKQLDQRRGEEIDCNVFVGPPFGGKASLSSLKYIKSYEDSRRYYFGRGIGLGYLYEPVGSSHYSFITAPLFFGYQKRKFFIDAGLNFNLLILIKQDKYYMRPGPRGIPILVTDRVPFYVLPSIRAGLRF